MSEVSSADWKKFLRQFPDAHLLQTSEWGELKSAFGWEAVHLIQGARAGAQILFRRLPFGLTIAYLPKPVLGDEVFSAQSDFWDELDLICRRKKAICLTVEPDRWGDLAPSDSAPWIRSRQNIQPPRTIVVGLRGTEEYILGRMKQKCRYNIRLAEKKGITIRVWTDLQGFHRMLLATGQRDGFGVHSREYYQRAYDLFHPGDRCELFVAEFEGKALAALMVFVHGKRAWYVYGASSDEERNRMPTYLLQWQAMRWARDHGCEQYDLWGVPDQQEADLEANFEQRQDGLWGVYRFKRGFGGEVMRASQALDRVYDPLLYRVYMLRIATRGID